MHKKSRREKGRNHERSMNDMAVMAKPLNISLRVSEEKKDEFLSITRDTSVMLEKFKRLRKAEMLSGKKENDPNVVFLDKKIKEFENDLKR